MSMTHEDVEDMIKFGGVTAFRYCILNKLDFSIDIEGNDTAIATELYEEMWADENNLKAIRNEVTLRLNKKGI